MTAVYKPACFDVMGHRCIPDGHVMACPAVTSADMLCELHVKENDSGQGSANDNTETFFSCKRMLNVEGVCG